VVENNKAQFFFSKRIGTALVVGFTFLSSAAIV